jgi:hypothetical protein
LVGDDGGNGDGTGIGPGDVMAGAADDAATVADDDAGTADDGDI